MSDPRIPRGVLILTAVFPPAVQEELDERRERFFAAEHVVRETTVAAPAPWRCAPREWSGLPPQAPTHRGLISAAVNLHRALG